MAIVARENDCLGCSIVGAFVAVRALQRRGDGGLVPPILLLAAVRSGDDTVAYSRTLARERVAAKIQSLDLSEVERRLGAANLPAVFVIANGRIVKRWTPGQGPLVEIDRDELRRVVDSIAHRGVGSNLEAR